jgi:hypothetical protein
MKNVNQSKAAGDLSAYVILNKKGVHVATVQAHYGSGGGVQVDVWGKSELIHQVKVGGYGYDKFTAALAGAVIDGVKLYDHCGGYEPEEKALKARLVKVASTNPDQAKRLANKHGMHFGNWVDGKPTSAFFVSGLDRLSTLGYKVIKAI